MSSKRRDRHRVTPFAAREGDDVVYRVESVPESQLDLPL